MPYWSPFDFWKLPTPLLLVDCLACIFPSPSCVGLLSPFCSQFKWYRGRGASYLKLAFMLIFFIMLLAAWNGLNLSDSSFYTCFQSHNDRNYIYHSVFYFFVLYLSTLGMKCWASFIYCTFHWRILYLITYTQKTVIKCLARLTVFIRHWVSRAHWFREDKAVDFQLACLWILAPPLTGRTEAGGSVPLHLSFLIYKVGFKIVSTL